MHIIGDASYGCRGDRQTYKCSLDHLGKTLLPCEARCLVLPCQGRHYSPVRQGVSCRYVHIGNQKEKAEGVPMNVLTSCGRLGGGGGTFECLHPSGCGDQSGSGPGYL